MGIFYATSNGHNKEFFIHTHIIFDHNSHEEGRHNGYNV